MLYIYLYLYFYIGHKLLRNTYSTVSNIEKYWSSIGTDEVVFTVLYMLYIQQNNCRMK